MEKLEKENWLDKIRNYKHKEIIAFTIVMFIVYLSTLSRSWDDEDSILFINGVKNFNVVEYRPHPPGYPVYIFFGKISYFLLKDELLSLTILSSIFGALSLAVFYFLIFEMYDKKTALMSAMLMAVTPLFWLNSLKAMSDMTGLFFILLSMYFIYHFIKYEEIKSLYIGSFVSAIAIGARFHALFVVAPLLIYACFKMKRRGDKKNVKITKDEKERTRKNQDKIFYSIIIFLIGILMWLIPTLVVNGFFGYFEASLGQFLVRFDKPGMSTLAGDFSFNYLFPRVKSFLGFFLGEGYGIDLWGFSILPVITLLIYLFILFLSYEKLNRKIIFFIAGLLFYLIMVFLFLSPHNPRYFLPLIPFISLLFVLGTFWFGKYNYLAFAFLFILLLIHAAPLAKEIHEEKASIPQLIEYLKTNYDLNETIIFEDRTSALYLDYYNFISYDSVYLMRGIHDESVFRKIQEGYNRSLKFNFLEQNKTILIINPDYSTKLIINSNYLAQDFNLTLIKIFERDIRVHAKDNLVWLYKIEK